ncbi:hypothetical protein ADT25_23025 [Xanthomonas oryzae]|uniref:Transposase n=1 Tax=Xanthomonas oryzae TaxID=347 RepID=A0AAP0ZGU9_9XANT|nr:hypothetical protein ADT25_23025 [Xanthomonas oryzae]
MSKRRKFSVESKRGAVEQAIQPGVRCAQLARKLGIGENLLTRWRPEAQTQGKVAFGDTGTPRDEELARLGRELARVKKEQDFLREAATFFAKEKRERVYRTKYQTPDAARADVFAYIEPRHNPRMRRRTAKQDLNFSTFHNRP